MNGQAVAHKKFKIAFGSAVLAALAVAAIMAGLGERRIPTTKAELEATIAGLPGFDGILSLKLDGVEYNGQEAARVVAVDVLVKQGAGGETLAGSMEAAGNFVRERISIYRKYVITGYKRPADFDAGLAFRSRALWLAPEFAAPMDGWSTIRVPDEPRPVEKALDGIYAHPAMLSVKGGELTATIDLGVERRGRAAAGAAEILTLALVDSFDFDNAFDRCPALTALDVTLFSGGQKAGRFAITREAYTAAEVSRLLADLSKKALKVSSREFEIAERYSNTQLYTPLLFDAAVSAEDKAEIEDLESRRREAETEFYSRLFAGGTWEPPSAETFR
jgi:hypothetical protein